MSIRDLLSYFRPSKASVEPVSRTDDPEAALLRVERVLAKRDHTFMAAADHDFTSWKPDPSAGSVEFVPVTPSQWNDLKQAAPAPQHPLAPEINPPPLDWDVWTRMARENQRRGWSFCRYAARGPTGLACLFGIVRGPWGIAKMDFWICGPGAWDTLHSVTHLPSGVGFGLFTDQESAAVACDIAARLADDFEAIDLAADPAFTREAVARMHTAWTAAGITPCATHAHASADHNSPALPIWFQDYNTIVMGRPEKLS